jgi:DNA-binding response OmpR family regulator
LLSHDQLARQVWGGEYPGYRDALKQYVHQLRQKLEKTPSHPTRILTRRGHGYLFRPIGGTRSSQP